MHIRKIITFLSVTVTLLLVSAVAFAEGTGAVAEAGSDIGLRALAKGLTITLAAFGGAMAQGRAATAALEGIARNPGASSKIFTPLILSLALIESLVIYALIIAFMIPV